MLKVVGNEWAQGEADGRSLLDEIAREGARRMLLAAVETEVAAYLETHREERDDEGHTLVVRDWFHASYYLDRCLNPSARTEPCPTY